MGGVNIVYGNGGIGRRPAVDDAISGMIANAIAAGTFTLGTVYGFRSAQDAIDIGIDADYDADNGILVYEHIKEFFRMNSSGTLYFMGVAQATSFANLVDPTVSTSAIKLLRAAEGKVKQLGVVYNPTAAVTDTTALMAAIPKAQLLVAQSQQEFMPVRIILEGKGFDSGDITGLRDQNANGCSVMVGQTGNDDIQAIDATYGAVGTALGALSLAKVNENIGWVGKFNLLGDNLQSIKIGGVAYNTLSPTVIQDMDDAGYIFFLKHQNQAGIYMNFSHTADVTTSDYCTLENGRTMDKAGRLIRSAILPYLNSPVLIDPSTGKIAGPTAAAMQAAGNRAIQPMFQANEISGPDPDGPNPPFTIDPDQDILSTSDLIGKLVIVPVGVAAEITLEIGFTNPNNA